MKKIVLLLAVALVLPGVAAAQDYVYTGREGKMMLVGDMASKRLEQKKAQKKARNESKKEQPKKAATQKNQGLPYYYYGREGKAMILGELTAKWLEQKKAQFPSFFRSKFYYFLSLRNTDSHRFFLYAGSQGAPPQIHLHLPCPYTVCVI